jgi:hypothetical protein
VETFGRDRRKSEELIVAAPGAKLLLVLGHPPQPNQKLLKQKKIDTIHNL